MLTEKPKSMKNERLPDESFEEYKQRRRQMDRYVKEQQTAASPITQKETEKQFMSGVNAGMRSELKKVLENNNFQISNAVIENVNSIEIQKEFLEGVMEGMTKAADEFKQEAEKSNKDSLVTTLNGLVSHFKIVETHLSSIVQSVKSIATSLGIQTKQQEQGRTERELEKQKDEVTKESSDFLYSRSKERGMGLGERVGYRLEGMKQMFAEGLKMFAADMLEKITKLVIGGLVGGAFFNLLPDNIQEGIKSSFKGLWEGLESVFPSLKSFREAVQGALEVWEGMKTRIVDIFTTIGDKLGAAAASVVHALSKIFDWYVKMGKRLGLVDETAEDKDNAARERFVEERKKKARGERNKARAEAASGMMSEMAPQIDIAEEDAADRVVERDAVRDWNKMRGQGGAGPGSRTDIRPIQKPALTPGQPGASTEGIEKEITPEGRALLNQIASTEAPDYNTIYGGKKFGDMSDHPREYVKIESGPNKGKYSSAAGRYQFIAPTWDALKQKHGLKDFSPQSQDKAAWLLAQEDYTKKTGRNLQADLKGGDSRTLNNVSKALSSTWTSMQGGIEESKKYGNTDFAADFKRHRGEPAQVASLEPSVPTSAARVDQASVEVATARETRGQTTVVQAPAQITPQPPRQQVHAPVIVPVAIANRGSLDRDIHMSTLMGAA